MTQPQALTTQQLDAYQSRIRNAETLAQKKAAAIAVYQELYDKGYNYAGWALGVASGSTVTETAAVAFLTDTALMGLGGEACRHLSAAQIDKIRVDMADATLTQMIAQSGQTNNVLTEDLGFKPVSLAHKRVFEDNGLSLSNWTLQAPMEIYRQVHGEAAAEALWVQLRDTAGDGIDGMLASAQLVTFMGLQASTSPDPAIRQAAVDWTNQVPGTGNWQAVQRSADLVLQFFKGQYAGHSLTDSEADVVAAVVKQVQQQALQGAAASASHGQAVPTDAPTRNSASYLIDTSANDHQVVLGQGGTLWDAYVLQKDRVGGLNNWSDFQAAVAVCNPGLSDPSRVAAGTTLYLPERMADGSLTYHYESDASINLHAHDYHMVVPNAQGGQTVYSRTYVGDLDAWGPSSSFTEVNMNKFLEECVTNDRDWGLAA